ncbi:ParA family protein [Aporhodopirellula aestuarii]|uniref:ParA family protein n=1 Tax=Aporhodopirellula aestuarii TaxID=2950107 RepID=A0ABT0UCH2_9BACT|nr:ParA family protein [Aporhodopirellula aestuarii]MCM2374697.1 ParA family protein [Aporhodopirellula aestuarii]
MEPASQHRAEIITVLNLKGGVGKTHTSWLLAGVCEERGLKCLCIDLDAQRNLTRNLIEGASPVPGIEMLFHPGSDSDAEQLIRRSRFEHIDLIPASYAVAPFDLSNQDQWESVDSQRSLHDALDPLRDRYDFILCDCPPRLSLVSFASLVASDHCLIPLEAADWGAQGVTQVTEAVHYVQKRENARLHLLGYLISRFKTARSYQHSYLTELRKHFGEFAFDIVVSDLAGFEKSVTHAHPVNLRKPHSREAKIARRLFDEVCERIGKNADSRSGNRQSNVSEIVSTAV